MDSRRPRPPPLEGSAYVSKLLKFLSANRARLAQPPHAAQPTGPGNLWQQSYTLLTLGLDPNSSPLSWNLAVPLTLGFGSGSSSSKTQEAQKKASGSTASSGVKPLTLRLPPDRLLYLLLLFQSSPTPALSSSPNIGRTDVPVPPGVQLVASRPGSDGADVSREGDVKSVRSWVGSLRSVGLGTVFGQGRSNRSTKQGGWGWFGGKKEVMDDDARLRAIYAAFTILPSLIIHPPSPSDPLIKDLVEENAYTSLGGIDVRVPLSIFRGLWSLELEGYDPRGVLIPLHPGLKSLTVRDVPDGEDWLEELLGLAPDEPSQSGGVSDMQEQADEEDSIDSEARPRFPSLRHLALPSTSLFSLPTLTCPSLTHLDLSHNLLNAIPPSLSSIHTLQTLNLSNNMIESVRGANLILGQVHVLNLRNNRIDCLSGLDRVLGLERIDLRKNRLHESAEVGRLALLPLLKEVWVGSGNDFVETEEDWRVKVFVSFAEEGNEDLLIDGDGPSWGEAKAVQNEVNRRGRRSVSAPRQAASHVHQHRQESVAGTSRLAVSPATPRRPQHAVRNGHSEGARKQPPAIDTSQSSAGEVNSPTASVVGGSKEPKRRRQRIVDLDGTVRQVAGSESEDGTNGLATQPRSSGEIVRRSERALGKLPAGNASHRASTMGPASNEPKDNMTAESPSTRGQRDKAEAQRRAASQGEEVLTVAPIQEMTGDELRARMEALKMEVGDSWLKVLAGQAKNATQVTGGVTKQEEDEEVRGPAGDDEVEEQPPPPPTVQVVPAKEGGGSNKKKNKKKKRKAAASARID